MSTPIPSVPLSAPPPGGPALARARRIVHEGGPTRRDLVYRAYVAVLLTAMIGVPLLTGLTSAIPGDRAAAVVWGARQWFALPLVLCAVAPTHLGPVITSAGELHYLVDGPFGARRVLAGRTWTVLGAVLVVVGALAVTVAVGLGLDGPAVATTTAWALGQAALVVLALLGIQSAWSRPSRLLAALTGAGLAALAHLGGRGGWTLGGRTDAVVAAVLGVAVCLTVAAVPLLLDRVPMRVLEHDVRVRHLIRTGLGTGDVGALSVHDGPRHRHLRGRTLPFGGGLLRRTVAVGVLGAMRAPWRTAGALLALVAVGTWIGAVMSGESWASSAGGLPSVLAAPAALLVTQWAFTVLSGPLTDVLESLGAGSLDPAPFDRMYLAHLVLPWSLVVVVTGVAAGVGAALGGTTPAPGQWSTVAGGLVLVALVAPCTSLAMVASSSPPLALLTPTPSPFGDSSSLVVVAWMLRGLTPAAVLAAVLALAVARDLPDGRALWGCALVLLVACVAVAGLRARSLARTDRHARGEEPATD